MRTTRPSKVAGYVVVGSGINPLIDSPTLFQDIQAWVIWKRAYARYELVAIPADRIDADEMIVPAAVYDGGLSLVGMALARFGAWWRNVIRRRINREHQAREARYFSQACVDARRKAAQ